MNVGDLIDGKYELTRLIGHGGMGSVFEARHVHIGRRFALKFLHTRLIKDPQITTRFLREAQAATTAGSEHIVAVNDMGTSPEGAPYLVLEYIEGIDLSTLLRQRGPLEPQRAARLMIQVCRGLGAAHARGIIHRDLKPENLMLTVREDGTEWIKILDFGVAKFRDALAAGAGQLTGEATFLGTPQYMAPEQMGEARDADWRSDIYSAGVVLYELLAGKPPYAADTLGKLLVALSSDPLPLRSVRPDIEEELSALVGRAMERTPDDRFQSMEALASALLPFSDIRPSQRPATLIVGTGQTGWTSSTLPSTPGVLCTPAGGATTPSTPVPPSTPATGSPSRSSAAANVRTQTPTPHPSAPSIPQRSSSGSTGSIPSATHVRPKPAKAWLAVAVVVGLGAAVAGAAGVLFAVDWNDERERRGSRNGDGGVPARSDGIDAGPTKGADVDVGGDARTDSVRCTAGKVPAAGGDGSCCWPGQTWSSTARRCFGVPRCPPGQVARRDRCVCPHGQIKNANTDHHCCWPRQAWSDEANRCVGQPLCPEGFWMHQESCLEVPPCPLGKVASTATRGHCCWTGQLWSDDGRECSGKASCPRGFEPSGSDCRPDSSDLGKLIQRCEEGSIASCVDLGVEYHTGREAELDYRRAAQLYRKGCDGNDPAGCNNLGLLYETGLGMMSDPVKAVELFRQACDRGSASGCTSLGTAHHLGRGVDQDYLAASRVYTRACERGEAHACHNLGLLFVDGTGVPQDFAKAAVHFTRACELESATGCCSIGILLLRGFGIPRDEAKARQFIQRACQGNEPWACQWLQDPTTLGPNVQRLTYYGLAATVNGDAPIGQGAQCRIVITPAFGCGHNCRVRIACGQQLIYGAGASGYNGCRIEQTVGAPPSIEVHDSGYSTTDSDPRLDLWTAAGRATVVDDDGESSWSATLQVSGPIAR